MGDTAQSFTYHRKSAVSMSSASVYSQPSISPMSLHSARQSVAHSRRTRSWCSSVFHRLNGIGEDDLPPPVPTLPRAVIQDTAHEVETGSREGEPLTSSSMPMSGHPSILPPLLAPTPYTSLSNPSGHGSLRPFSATHVRPRGPRGPLLSYSQLYGDRQAPSGAASTAVCHREDELADNDLDMLPPYEAGRGGS